MYGSSLLRSAKSDVAELSAEERLQEVRARFSLGSGPRLGQPSDVTGRGIGAAGGQHAIAAPAKEGASDAVPMSEPLSLSLGLGRFGLDGGMWGPPTAATAHEQAWAPLSVGSNAGPANENELLDCEGHVVKATLAKLWE